MQKLSLTSSTGYDLALVKNILPIEMNSIVIACHGFLGGKENGGWINYLASQLQPLGIGLVAFDFEGCGESAGNFADITLSRQISNLHDVMDYVYAEYNLPLILLGRSFGGSTVIAASNRKEVAGVILWATPVLLTETFYNIMPAGFRKMKAGETIEYIDGERLIRINPNFAQDLVNHDMDKYLENIKAKPALVIHGRADKTVSLDNCHHIATKLSNSEVHIIEDADHSFTGKEKLRIDLTIQWISTR